MKTRVTILSVCVLAHALSPFLSEYADHGFLDVAEAIADLYYCIKFIKLLYEDTMQAVVLLVSAFILSGVLVVCGFGGVLVVCGFGAGFVRSRYTRKMYVAATGVYWAFLNGPKE
jgi:hypothetical protein